jgi:hypothetical protein
LASVLGILWMRSVFDASNPLVLAFAGGFIVISFVAFARGDRHRPTWRPAILGLGGVVILDVLAFSGAAAAHGWSIHDAPRWMSVGPRWPASIGLSRPVESRDGHLIALAVGGEHWGGFEEQIAIVDRVEKTARVLPIRYALAVSFSPSGKHLLAEASVQPGGWLIALETGGIERLGAAWGDGPMAGFGAHAVLWRGERPFFVRQTPSELEVREPGGALAARCAVAASGEPARVCGERVALLTAGGRLSLLDPWTGRVEEVLGAENSVAVDTIFSPGDERAVLVAERDGRTRVRVADLATGTSRAFECQDIVGNGVFSPDRRKLAMTRVDRAVLLDLESGRTEWFIGDAQGRAAAWSPDGARLALPWGEIRDLAAGKAWGTRRALAAFVTPGIGILAGEPLVFLDLATGAVLARPLEGR